MPMDDGTTLGTTWWNDVKALQSFSPALTPAQDAAGLALWKKIASDLITYVKANMTVASTGSDPQGGTVSTTGTPS